MRWKWVLLTSVVIIVGLIITAYMILSTYNYNRLKPEIAQAFKETTGRELTLAGNISLRVSLAPTLVVENVGVQNAAWGSQPEMAEIKRFEIQVALFPLIFGHVDVKRLILIDPDILIETRRSGQSNLDFLKKIASPKTKKGDTVKGRVALTVNELRIEKGRITYRNEKSTRTYLVEVDRLAASAASTESPVQLKLNGSYNGEPFRVVGTVVPLESLISTGRPCPLDLTLTAAGATLTLDGTIKDVPSLQGIDLKFTAKSEDLEKASRLVGKPLPLKGRLDISGRVSDPKLKVYGVSDLKAAFDGSDLGGSVQLDFSGSRPAVASDLSSKRLDLRPFLAKGTQEAATVNPDRESLFPDGPLPMAALRRTDAAVTYRAGEVLMPRIALQDLVVDMTLREGRLSVRPLTAVIGGGTLDGRFNLQPRGDSAEVETVMKIDHADVGAMLKELNRTKAFRTDKL